MVSRNVMVTWLRNPSVAKIFVINEISVSLLKKMPNCMSFSSLNCTKCISHQGICNGNDHLLWHGTTGLINPSPGVFFFLNTRPDEEGQATSPLESLFDSPQLSVRRKFKLIARQNTPCRLY